MSHYPNLFTPLTVGKITFRNRIFTAPNMVLKMEEGKSLDDFIGFTEAKARGGAAQVTLGDTPCDIEKLLTMRDHEIEDTPDFKVLTDLSSVIKRHGSVASIELIHAGDIAEPFVKMRMIGGAAPMGPTGYKKASGTDVIEMNEEMIEKAVRDSAMAVHIYKRAGFDMIMIQGGHFWLLNQFLSPLWNKRTDRFGGGIENRARFPLMMLDRIREKIGGEMLIEYRLSGDDLLEGGNKVDDIIKFIKMAENRIDIIHVSCGSKIPPTELTAFGPYGCNVHLSEAIKKSGTALPVAVVGNILDPDLAERIIAEGKADIVSMARALIADPDLPNKAASGRSNEIIPCLRCFVCQHYENEVEGCYKGFQCAVNPRTARKFVERSSGESKKILVIGGGVAGITAALTAEEKGHSVMLVEKTSSLGGLLKFIKTDTIKTDIRRFYKYLLYRMDSSNINVFLNTDPTPEFIKMEDPDAVFIGVGSIPIVPKISGIERAIQAIDVYMHPERLGQRVIIIGGGMTGCEVSLHLANLGKEVRVVEFMDTIARDANPQHFEGLLAAMSQKNIDCLTGLNCTDILPDHIKVTDKDGSEKSLEADTVVYAVGMMPVKDVAERLSGIGMPIISIGDCAQVGNVMSAVYDGFFGVHNLLS